MHKVQGLPEDFVEYLAKLRQIMKYCADFTPEFERTALEEKDGEDELKQCGKRVLEKLLKEYCHIEKAVFYLYREEELEASQVYSLRKNSFIGGPFEQHQKEILLARGEKGIPNKYAQREGWKLFKKLRKNFPEKDEFPLVKDGNPNYEDLLYTVVSDVPEEVRSCLGIDKDQMLTRQHLEKVLPETASSVNIQVCRRPAVILDHEYIFRHLVEWLTYEELLKNPSELQSQEDIESVVNEVYKNTATLKFFTSHDRKGEKPRKRSNSPNEEPELDEEQKNEIKCGIEEIVKYTLASITDPSVEFIQEKKRHLENQLKFNPYRTRHFDTSNLFMFPVIHKKNLIGVVVGAITNEFIGDVKIYQKLEAFLDELVPPLLMEEREQQLEVERRALAQVAPVVNLFSHSLNKAFTTPLKNVCDQLEIAIAIAEDSVSDYITFIREFSALWEETFTTVLKSPSTKPRKDGKGVTGLEHFYLSDLSDNLVTFKDIFFSLHINDLYDDPEFAGVKELLDAKQWKSDTFFNLELELGNCYVYGHESLFKFHLLNFLENSIEALDYTRLGKGFAHPKRLAYLKKDRIRFEVEQDEKTTRITISDTGRGIQPEMLEPLTELFSAASLGKLDLSKQKWRDKLVRREYTSKSGGALGWALPLAAEYFSKIFSDNQDGQRRRGSICFVTYQFAEEPNAPLGIGSRIPIGNTLYEIVKPFGEVKTSSTLAHILFDGRIRLVRELNLYEAEEEQIKLRLMRIKLTNGDVMDLVTNQLELSTKEIAQTMLYLGHRGTTFIIELPFGYSSTKKPQFQLHWE